MLTLITAVPGSGKTLYSVGLINDLLQKGDRFVYHNIDGLNIDSPFLFPAPDDWRTVPDGSIIFYDECQELFPATGKAGRVNDDVLTDLELHRHRGIDIYFITQHPTFIHHHIRKLCGEHIHFYRSSGIAAAAKYSWSHVVLEPNDRAEQRRANCTIFKFDKKLFSLYKSTVLNTHKFKMPRKGWYFIFGILLIISIVIFNFRNGLQSVAKPDVTVTAAVPSQALASAPQTNKTVSNPVSTSHWAASPTIPAVSGCIHFPSKRRCACYSSNGLQLDMTYAACVSALSAPLPRSLNMASARQSQPLSTVDPIHPTSTR